MRGDCILLHGRGAVASSVVAALTREGLDAVRTRYAHVTELAPDPADDPESQRFCLVLAAGVLGLPSRVAMVQCSGRTLKRWPLVHHCRDPDGARALLAQCRDDELYAFLRPEYLGESLATLRPLALCDPWARGRVEDDEGRMVPRYRDVPLGSREEWWKEGRYTSDANYVVLPDGTLRLGQGHHSAFACGQPVVCAGQIRRLGAGGLRLDNQSGHYTPSDSSFHRALDRIWQPSWPPLARFDASAELEWEP